MLKVKEEHLKPYQQYLEDMTKTFNKIEYTIIPRAHNQFADALATLASMVKIPKGVWTQPLEIEKSYELVHNGKTESLILAIEEEGVPWYYDILKFLELGVYPDDTNKREHHSIRMIAMQYILCGGQLYRRSYDGIHLCCLKKNVAERVMEEVHQGICGPHMNGRMLAKKILTMGYYWNSTEIDCVDFMKSCHDCQTHVNLNHVPPSKPYNMISPWPFLIWGIGVIGRIALK